MVKRLKRTFALDRRALGLFRIGLGSLLLIDLLLRARFLVEHYTDRGVLPRVDYLASEINPYFWSVHLANGHTWFIGLLFVLNALVAALFAIGYRWRTMGVLYFVLLVSLHNRNPFILHSGDVMLRLMLFWGLFLPLGDRFSLRPGHTKQTLVTSVATVGYCVQLSLVYFFGAIYKLHPAWYGGDAVRRAMMLDQFTTPVGDLLAQYPTLMEALTYAVLGLEFMGPLLIVTPVLHERRRYWLVVAFFALHLGLFFCMNLGLFPFIAMVAWVALIPSTVFESERPSLRPETASHLSYALIGRRIRAVLLGLVLIGIVIWNAGPFSPALRSAFSWISPAMYTLRLDQRWRMFGPYPRTADRWYVLQTTFHNDRQGDVYRGGPVGGPVAIDWDKPADVAADYTSTRWRKYLMNLTDAPTEQRDHYLKYVCRTLDRRRADGRGPEVVSLYVMTEPTTAEGEVIDGMKRLHKRSCGADE